MRLSSRPERQRNLVSSRDPWRGVERSRRRVLCDAASGSSHEDLALNIEDLALNINEEPRAAGQCVGRTPVAAWSGMQPRDFRKNAFIIEVWLGAGKVSRSNRKSNQPKIAMLPQAKRSQPTAKGRRSANVKVYCSLAPISCASSNPLPTNATVNRCARRYTKSSRRFRSLTSSGATNPREWTPIRFSSCRFASFRVNSRLVRRVRLTAVQALHDPIQ